MQLRYHCIAKGRYFRAGEDVPEELLTARLRRYAVKEEAGPLKTEDKDGSRWHRNRPRKPFRIRKSPTKRVEGHSPKVLRPKLSLDVQRSGPDKDDLLTKNHPLNAARS